MSYLDECCHFFYEWPLNAVIHKKKKKAESAIVSQIILHHQGWCPNFNIYCRQKLLAILQYSKSFKWIRSNQNTGKMYKII